MRTAKVYFAVTCTLLVLSILLKAQDEIPTFRTSVSVVKVNSLVTEASGASISGLDKDDFVVFDEEQQRQILDFNRETEPMYLLLLLDVSGSMSKALSEMSVRTTAALRQLRPADQVGLMVFAEKSELISDFSSDKAVVGSKITNTVFKSGWGQETIFNDSLLAATKQFARLESKGRKSILMVTDGAGSRGTAKDAQVLRALQDADIVLNVIAIGQSPAEDSSRRQYRSPGIASPQVERYARETGGSVASGGNSAELLTQLVRTIATRYNFDYSAPQGGETGSYRKIRVELTPQARKQHPGAVIKARAGYFVE